MHPVPLPLTLIQGASEKSWTLMSLQPPQATRKEPPLPSHPQLHHPTTHRPSLPALAFSYLASPAPAARSPVSPEPQWITEL